MKCRCHSCSAGKPRKFCQTGSNAGKPGPCPEGQASQARPDSAGRTAYPKGAAASQMRPDATSDAGSIRPMGKEEEAAREKLAEAIKAKKSDLTGSRKLKDQVVALRKEVHGHLSQRLARQIEEAKREKPHADRRVAGDYLRSLKPGEYVTDGGGNVGAVVQIPVYSHMGQGKKVGHENAIRWVGTGDTDPSSNIRTERLVGVRSLGVTTHALANASKFSETSALHGVEAFASGTHRGQEYTPRDIDDMVRNFNAYSSPVKNKPLVRVPAVLGHEESQEYLERSDLPAAAWARKVYAEDRTGPDGKRQRVLKVDFEDVPPKVARLLKGKRYRTVSAEVYDDPPEGVPGKGKMLRRVAFLGGDIPQVKSLEDIPTPVDSHSEAGGHYTPVVLRFREAQQVTCADGVCFFRCFAEVIPMDREQLLKRLADLGYDVGLLTDAVPDPVLAEMVRVTEDAKDQGEPDGDEPPADEPDGTLAEDDEEVEGDEPPGGKEPPHSLHADAEEPEAPEDREDDKAMAEYGRAMAEYRDGCHAHADGEGATVTKTATKFGEADVRRIVNTAVKAAKDQVRKEFADVRRETGELVSNTRRASVEKFCEAMVAAGKVMPAELDAGDAKHPRPTLADRLLRADAKAKVHKFSEGGKTLQLTELELQMKEIEARPVLVRFGERVKSGGKVQDDDADKAKVAAHFERFSEDFTRQGMTRDKLLAGFDAERKRRPRLTADEYLAV